MPFFQCSNGHKYFSSGNFTFCPQCFDETRKEQTRVLIALEELKYEATTRQIAEKTELHIDKVSQGLSGLYIRGFVEHLGSRCGDCVWKIK